MDDEATQLLRELLAKVAHLEAAQGKSVSTLTVSAAYAEYAAASSHKHSWRMEEDKLAPTVAGLGHVLISELTPQRWEKHRATRRAQPIPEGRRNAGKPASEATLNVELSVAKNMLQWLVEQGHLDHNPLRPTRHGKTRGSRKTWIPESALQRILSAGEPKGAEQRLAFCAWLLVKADTGLRFSEALKIRRDRVRQGPDGWVLDIDSIKGGKPHTVGLTPRVLRALAVLPHVLGSPYYIVRRVTGQLYGKRTVYGWFRAACESCGVDSIVVEGEVRVRPHDARRSAATKANEEGASLFEIQAMLGHSSPATTARYIQRTPASASRMAKLLAAATEREHRKPAHSADAEAAQAEQMNYFSSDSSTKTRT